jgi:hypothetical protein
MTPQELRRNILFAILSNSERTQGKTTREIINSAADIALEIEMKKSNAEFFGISE